MASLLLSSFLYHFLLFLSHFFCFCQDGVIGMHYFRLLDSPWLETGLVSL